MRLTLLTGLALLAAPVDLTGQSDSLANAVGKRIRATYAATPSRTRRVAAPLLRVSGDSLFLIGADHSELAISRSALRRIEISSGRRTRTGHGAALGALIGFGAGAVSGVVICQIISSCDASGSDSLIEGELTVAVAGILGVGGALAGTGIGAIAGSFAHTDRWRPLRLGAIRSTRSEVAGIRLGLAIPF